MYAFIKFLNAVSNSKKERKAFLEGPGKYMDGKGLSSSQVQAVKSKELNAVVKELKEELKALKKEMSADQLKKW